MNDKKVRVRYAPSPTGMLHIGGARSALFNYLYAKKYDGDFVFRVEDTDVERNIEGGEESQLNDLIWLGIVPDESPLKPVEKYAPYRQMERLDTYRYYAKWLLEHGYAYECYCNEEELQRSRDEQIERGIAAPQYDGHCLHLTAEQIAKYKAEGRTPCIRIKMPKNHELSFDDLVRGRVKFNSDDIGDWVIMKSNGIPTYNFAVVIDDHMMEMTHVFRGEEHLSNTPKQLQIYEYLGWEAPKFGHMTIIINENGKKLSKRDHNILQFMSQYRDLGYLPQAITNFILLLGWTPDEEREIFTLQEACKAFNPKKLSSSPSMFDQQKLNWMNGQYIKNMSDEDYLIFIKPFIFKALNKDEMDDEQVLFLGKIFKDQILFGAQIIDLLREIFEIAPIEDEEALQVLNSETTPSVLDAMKKALNDASDLEKDTIKNIFKEIANSTGVKGKALYMPIRLKLTGHSHGAELYNIIKVLGKDECIRRLD